MSGDTIDIPWPECVTLVGDVPVIVDGCYVLTHDSSQTVCACNTSYDILGACESIYNPIFLGTKYRENDNLTWTGYMTDVYAAFCALLLRYTTFRKREYIFSYCRR